MFVLNKNNSIANHFLAELRDVNIQNDRLRFRKNLERIGEILAYEVSKKMNFHEENVTTPLGKTHIGLLDQQPVLIPILRAGIPFYQGVLNYFDHAESGFIGAFRKHEGNESAFEIQMDYVAAPSLEARHVMLIDPMLATGKSLIKTYDNLKSHGQPAHVDVLSVIASPEGVKYVQDNLDVSHNLWLGAIDGALNERAYIIPGLGDAGDLSYGDKL